MRAKTANVKMMNVTVSNINLEDLKQKIASDGKDKFHVVADFDGTLTKTYVNGKEIPSIISILRDGNYLTPDYSQKAHELYRKYHAIEIDQKISDEEKQRKMLEWWTLHFELLIKSGLNKKDLERVVESGGIQLRRGVLEFIDFLNQKNIPLIILSSSGLGTDTINLYLQNQGRLYPNVQVISNAFNWDKKGFATGVKKPIIHSFNKDETAIRNNPVFQNVRERKNVLLLGNSPGDTKMISGLDYETLIKIGFLNEKVTENLEEFKRRFHVVITEDGNFDYVNNLVNLLFR